MNDADSALSHLALSQYPPRSHPPSSDHVLINRGIGGTKSGIYSACAETMVDEVRPLISTASHHHSD